MLLLGEFSFLKKNLLNVRKGKYIPRFLRCTMKIILFYFKDLFYFNYVYVCMYVCGFIDTQVSEQRVQRC